MTEVASCFAGLVKRWTAVTLAVRFIAKRPTLTKPCLPTVPTRRYCTGTDVGVWYPSWLSADCTGFSLMYPLVPTEHVTLAMPPLDGSRSNLDSSNLVAKATRLARTDHSHFIRSVSRNRRNQLWSQLPVFFQPEVFNETRRR